jgi:pimeloyl-ACP methyl ester carboxylesterase
MRTGIVSPMPSDSDGGTGRLVAEPFVLILSGAGDPSSVWSLVREAVAQAGVQCEVVEYPMKGVNTEPQPRSIEEYAQWVLAMIDERDLSDVVLAGHSMGALIAIEAASSGSERLSALIAMCPAEPMFVHPSLLAKAESDPVEAARMIAGWSYSPGSREPLEHVIMSHMAATSALGPGVLASDLHACNNYENASTAVSDIEVPATIVLSGDDHMTPRSAATPLLEVFDGSVVHVLEDSGHAIEHEQPREVAAIIVGAATRSDSAITSGIST